MDKRVEGSLWDQDSVKELRGHLDMTQQELARELGARQQTISEWERGMYRPRGTSARLLSIIAERAGFEYRVGPQRNAPPEKSEDD